jgi:hypothetical protein
MFPAVTSAAAYRDAMHVVVTAVSGDSAAARYQLDSLLQRYPLDAVHSRIVRTSLAAAFVAVGATTQGLELLDEQQRLTNGLLLVDPLWDPVRQDSAFRRIQAAAQASRRNYRLEL